MIKVFNINTALLSIIFLICFGLGYALGENIFFFDEGEYIAIAESISNGTGFALDGNLTASRAPLYPFLISFFNNTGLGIFGMRIVNISLLIFTLVLLQKILSSYFHLNKYYSLLIILLSPVFIYLSVLLLPQTLGTFLLMLFLYLLSTAHSNNKYIFMGATFGFLCLTIPNFLILGLLFPFLFKFICQSEEIQIKNIFFYFLFMSIPILFWVARNYIVFELFIPISSVSGFNLFLGNSESASYNTGFYPLTQEINEYIASLNEFEKDKYFRSLAIDWIFKNPSDFVILYFFKFINFFNFTNDFSSTNTSIIQSVVLFISYYSLLLLTILRLMIPIRISNVEKIIYLFYFITAFVNAIFFTRIRYRIPFDVALMMPAIVALDYYIKLIFRKNVKT